MATLRGRTRRETSVPDGLAALAVDDGGGTVVLLANLTPGPRTVAVGSAGGATAVAELAGWGTAEVRLG